MGVDVPIWVGEYQPVTQHCVKHALHHCLGHVLGESTPEDDLEVVVFLYEDLEDLTPLVLDKLRQVRSSILAHSDSDLEHTWINSVPQDRLVFLEFLPQGLRCVSGIEEVDHTDCFFSLRPGNGALFVVDEENL